MGGILIIITLQRRGAARVGGGVFDHCCFIVRGSLAFQWQYKRPWLLTGEPSDLPCLPSGPHPARGPVSPCDLAAGPTWTELSKKRELR